VTGSYLPGSYDPTKSVAEFYLYIPSAQSSAAVPTYFIYGGAYAIARISDDDQTFILSQAHATEAQYLITGFAFDQ